MLHYDGITWDFIDNAPFYSFNSFWGSPDKDYFVVGASGIILYYVGDADNDEMSNDIDNCINVYNPLQEDSYPPQGNSIGDGCDCEGNFNCDGDVDGSDASTFKADFGRSLVLNPCANESPCDGDFNCDGDEDGVDAALFKQDFGRSAIQNPCPACVSGGWCFPCLPDGNESECTHNYECCNGCCCALHFPQGHCEVNCPPPGGCITY